MASTGTKEGVAGAPGGDRAEPPGHRRHKHTAPLLTLTAVTLLASLVALVPAGAAEEPVGESAPRAATASAEPTSGDSAGGVEVVRYAGSDQYELSLAVAQALVETDGGTSEWVVLASGESWTDAATAVPLAASLGAPAVLVPPGGLQTAAARPDLVEFLRSTGVRQVVIVGSPDVLPNHEPSVLFGLGMLPRNIERVHGDDPVGTSVAIAERIGPPAELGELGRTVFIASDQSVADAVAVGPLAAAGPFPLLLTASDALDPRIATYLTDLQIEHVVLVGGTVAIAPAVQEVIEAAGATVTRLAGRDRSDTARLVAELLEQHTGDDPACTDGPTRIGLVPAQHPEQALTAGALLARSCTPLRYTEPDQLPAGLRNTLYLARNRLRPVSVTLFGGENAIPSHVVDVDVPPVRFAAFNVRWNADVGRLVGVLQVIGEHGVVRSFPETEIILEPDAWIPSDWQRRPESVFSYWPGFSWSPDGERLAFWNLDASELYVLDLRDGELRRIAEVDSQDEYGSSLNWSPDGSQLAFSALVEDASTLSDPYLTVNGISEYTTELFVHDFGSAQTVRLTYNNFRDSAGLWSPDGTRLAFFQTPASSTWMSPAGLVAYVRLIVMDSATKESHELHPYVLSALWSPDGKMLALSAVPDGRINTRAHSLYLAAPDGSQIQEVPGPSCDGCRRYPSRFPLPWIYVDGWSPAGDQIAYSALFWYDRKGLTRQIASGEISEIFHESDEELAASGRYEGSRFVGWMPDGRSLMYLKSSCQADDRAGELSVIEIAADGSESSELLDLMPLVGDSSPSCYPAYGLGPSFQNIVFVDQRLGLHAAGLNGTGFDRLVTPTPRPEEVAFRIHDPCSVEWTRTGIHVGCRFSTGEF